MTDRCETIDAYVDGEMDAGETAEFELHLATCETCSEELPRLLALLAAFDRAAAATASGSARAPHLVLVGDEPAREAPGTDTPRRAVPEDDGARRMAARGRVPQRRTWVAAGGGAVALAAVLLVYLGTRSPQLAPPELASLDGELGPTRGFAARLSYPGTEQHRPFDVQRGTGAHETSDRLLQRELELEQARNWHGAAVAAMLAGDRDHAARAFVRAPLTPQVDSDRAAFELQDGTQPALERALEDVDRALAAAPDHAAAHWNRALVLEAMNLPLAAALELDRVRALGEPGWADEAGKRAAALTAQVVARRTRWKHAIDAGAALVENATPVPAELIGITGHMTLRLYDAVRSAPSRSAVEALLPLAQALDSAYRSDHLAAYVRRIAAADFRVRKPLADSYRELVLGRMSGPAVDAFLKRVERPGAEDLWMGAMVRLKRVASKLDDYRRLAAEAKDPWLLAIAEQETAMPVVARGARPAAEGRLRDAIGLARRERLAYRAVALEVDLVELYRKSQNLVQAHKDAVIAYRDATSLGEGVMEMNGLLTLAAIQQDRYAHGLARAYLTEVLARTDPAAGPSPLVDDINCSTRQYAHEALANVSLDMLDPGRAHAEISGAPTCSQGPTVLGTLVRAQLYRSSHRDEDLRIARANLAALRADPKITVEKQAMLAFIEGHLLIDSDRATGQRALREAITTAGHRTDDFNYSVKARAYSFSQLALDAGRASEFAGVLQILAETLEVEKPERCALAIAVEEDHAVVAFSDARGEVGGQSIVLQAPANPAAPDFATLVPAGVVDRLRACEQVVVLARPPVLGSARLLPRELAWGYRLKGTTSPPPAAAGQYRRLVVSNPDAPPDLKLPPLGPYADEPNSAGAVVLRGADATPTRVLQAMRDASVVELHTHGFIGNDVSEASYLVLSPDLDRQYTMTARDVSRAKLDAAPLVILGACHAATSSRSLEGGMGLAEAFLRSGARAVVASSDAVQDLGAPAFFAGVRERVMRGVDPAVALRDERLHRLAGSHDDAWVSGVVVFE